jgi:signal transduction histidine kinase
VALLILVCQLPAAMAQGAAPDRTLLLSGPVDDDTVGRYVDLLLDEDHSLGIEDVIADKANAFAPITTRVADVGYTDAMVWMRLKLENATVDSADWRLYFKENFKQIFHVYVLDENNRLTHALAQDLDSPFSSRAIAYPEIVVPLTLEKGARATVFVRFWTEGSTNLPLSIQTAQSFTEISVRNAAKQFVFYGMMIILNVAALLAWMVLRHPIFPAYIAYAGSTLLYLMHSDGVAFQYLWPNYPAFNSYASVVAGGGYAIFGAIYARIFLNTAKYHPVVDKLFLIVIVTTAAMVLSGLFIEPRFIKKYLILVVMCAVILFTVAAVLAARTRFKQVRFYVFAWLGATASALLMTLRHWFGIEISQEFQYDSMRGVMIFDAVMMALAIVDRFNQLREERQKALRSSLEQAQRNLAMNRRLRKLEARYELALETTSKHREHMENTVHDIRQPLHALRLAIQGSMDDVSSGSDKQYREINDGFTYIEGLLGDYLNAGETEPRDAQDAVSELELGEILGSIHEMFKADAEAKGLDFTYVPTSATVPVEPLVMMRIFSNLVSNAIKYTSQGRILLGVRRRGDAMRIEIHDSGPGLSKEAFESACRRGERLEPELTQVAGHGYGLAIVTDLARRHGCRLELLGERSSGTSVGVTVPA